MAHVIGRLACVLCVASALDAAAQSLPVRRYGIGDGLIHEIVGRVTIDSQGFLWAATGAGVSRFDGHGFVNYTTTDGLPDPVVNHVFEDSRGRTWVATNGGGLARFRARPDERHRLFDIVEIRQSRRSNRVNKLIEVNGGLWAATDEGLFRASVGDASPSFVAMPLDVVDPSDTAVAVFDIAASQDDTLWLATSVGLVRRHADGRSISYAYRADREREAARSVAIDPGGFVWAVHAGATVIWNIDHADSAGVRGGARPCAMAASQLELPDAGVCVVAGRSGNRTEATSVMATTTGSIVVSGMPGGVVEIRAGQIVPIWPVPDGVRLHNLAEDRQGNIWAATDNGLYHLARSGLRTWRAAPAGAFRVLGLADAGEGAVYAMGIEGWLHRISDRGVESVRPPAVARAMTASLMYQTPLRDRDGGWWIGTADGLYRFAPVPFDDLAHARPIAIYRAQDGLPSNLVGRLFEDSVGNLWIASRGNRGEVLARWERATNRIQRYEPADGIPASNVPYAFAEDRQGRIWVSFRDGGLGRFTGDRFQMIGEDAMRDAIVQALHVDRRGRLWLGTRGHDVLRVDEADRSPWRVVRYTSAGGPHNGGSWCFAEDAAGMIYAGGVRGVDRIDPATGRIDHLLPGEAHTNTLSALVGSDGRIWFGGTRGVLQFTPQSTQSRTPPNVRLRAVRVAGVEWPLSPLGSARIAGIRTDASNNRVEIEFFGLDEALDGSLRYQMRLEGADRDWTPPTSQRGVTYASLQPGQYRFLVRAVNASGEFSTEPAEVVFAVAPPIWQQGWFFTATLAFAVGIVYVMYRYRLQHVLAVERMRTRIAADLHDDIGSNLSKVTLLSEVVQREAALAGTASGERLAAMASIAHESIESMADIVWAVDPTKDRLDDLVLRMRRFVEEQCAAAGISSTFDAPSEERALGLDADLRREVLLVCKEAVNNSVRHAQCDTIRVSVRVEAGRLTLTVTDNGRGFVDTGNGDGNGLRSMKARAQRLGGELEVSPAPGGGTRITMFVPVRGGALRAIPTQVRRVAGSISNHP
jgi:ligand-binding sensor domain-containing protein/two-component sensor histidine kinase